MTKGRTVLFSAIAVIVSLIVSLAAAEMILRVKNSAGTNYDIEMWKYANTLKKPSDDPLMGHEHRPNKEAHLQNVDIRTNEYGLRGGPVPPLKPGERRILFLGSSITLGWGVPEDQTVTALIQEKFNKDGADVQVLNAGIGNYNTTRYSELLLKRLTMLEPTDIVINYFINDAEILPAGGGNWILRHSQLAVTLWIAANRLFGQTGMGNLESHYRAAYDPQSEGYKEMLAGLDRIKAYADAHHVRVYLAITPDVHQLTNYPFRYIHERMAGVAAKEGFTFVDLYPPFEHEKPENIWAMPGDPHPNARGHQLMADTLYPVLKGP
ncbi:MAG: GDSL-type esterase/lipase family protein [Alphaproteobacteria bacterium]|nr:GDSL-type esterase/lipase family protein [Alphaproteobacteria bacterium]